MKPRDRYLRWWHRTATRNMIAADRAVRVANGEPLSEANTARIAAALADPLAAGIALEKVGQLDAALVVIEFLWGALQAKASGGTVANGEAIPIIVPPKWSDHKH